MQRLTRITFPCPPVVKAPVSVEVGRQKRKYHKTGSYSKKIASKKFVHNHKFWTIEEKKKLLELSNGGMKQRQIAKLLGRKTSAVRNSLWILKHNPSWLAKAVNHRGRQKKA